MGRLTNDFTPILKQVKPYNLFAITQYLQIRYKVFINELGRHISDFGIDDLIGRHYILKSRHAIGTVRIIYKKNHIAEIGRVAILKKYRNQGYGTLIINQAMELVKANNQVNVIRLFTESEKIGFYKKFGFIENGEVFFDDIPYIDMVVAVNR